MSGIMTPESLSREGSPGPNEGNNGNHSGGILSQNGLVMSSDNPAQVVASHLEVKTNNFPPGLHHQALHGPTTIFGQPNQSSTNFAVRNFGHHMMNISTGSNSAFQPQVLNVLTASGQPIQLGPQKLIVTQQGQPPRLIVPAQQVALLSNGNEFKKEHGGVTTTFASRQILIPDSSERVETHKIISGPIGMSSAPIILQTAITNLP